VGQVCSQVEFEAGYEVVFEVDDSSLFSSFLFAIPYILISSFNLRYRISIRRNCQTIQSESINQQN